MWWEANGWGGEELLIGVRPVDGGTAVTGSTYLFDMQVSRFFAMLPPAASSAPAGLPASGDAAAKAGEGTAAA